MSQYLGICCEGDGDGRGILVVVGTINDAFMKKLNENNSEIV